MKESIYQVNYQKLQKLIEKVAIVDIPTLSLVSGVSQWQISRLLHGLILNQSIATLINLSTTLQISTIELLAIFAPEAALEPTEEVKNAKNDKNDLKLLQQEYQRLQQQLEDREQTLTIEFQQNSLEILESWLIQWPTAATAANGNTELPATRLLPLVKPIEKLIQQWGVQRISNVGEEIAYDPQYHQLMEGSAAIGEMVKVRYVGYRQGDRLLHRVQVSAISIG